MICFVKSFFPKIFSSFLEEVPLFFRIVLFLEGGNKMDILGNLGGKKFFVVILNLVCQFLVTLLGPKFGLSPEDVAELLKSSVIVSGTYLAGQSLADGLSKGATSHVAKKATADAKKK